MISKINKAVILAAGQGARLIKNQNKHKLKVLIKINNKTLILENIKNLKKYLGVKKIYIIGGYKYKILKRRFNQKKNIFVLNNKEWKKGNGYSLNSALKVLKNETFYLMAGDHFFSKNFYKKISKIKIDFGLACSKKLAFFHDINDVTKILSSNSKIFKIGKKIRKFNRFDAGFFIINKKYLNNTKKKSISEIIESSKTKIGEMIINENDWIDLDTETDIKNFKIAIKKKLFTI